MMLSKAITAFIAELKATGKAPGTCTAYESDLRRLASNAKHDSVLAFTEELVRNHLVTLSSVEELKLSTLHRKRACFGSFSRWGVVNKLWAADPLLAVPKIKRQRHLPRPFTREETARLLALALPPMEALARSVLFLTGLRVTPVCGIKLGDIDYDPPTIRAIVKGAKVQVVHMPAELAEAIKSYVLAHTNLKGHTFLFRKPMGAAFRRQEFEEMVAKWGKAAEVPACTPHRFRHTFATRLLELTKDIRLVQEAMGHGDIKSTMLYTEITGDRLRHGVGALTSAALIAEGSVRPPERPSE